MRHTGWRLARSLFIATGLLMAFAAPTMAAGTTEYPSSAASRTFNGGLAGWNQSTTFDGTCIPPLVCPAATNSYVGSGDSEGSGYITSSYFGVAGVGGIGGTTTATWESPAFTYSGNGGGAPGSLSLAMSRRSDVGQLLAIAGNSADYAVSLVDVSEGGNTETVIAPTTLGGADSWTTVSASVGASRLNLGDQYRVRIESIYSTGTSVLVTGSADYDNVALRASGSGNGGEGGGGGGSDGTNGKNGKGGRNSLRSAQLLAMFGSGQSSTAVLDKGKRLLVRVSCPKRIGGACRVTAQGLLKKHKPATKTRTVKVPKGKSRQVVLQVKPAFRDKVAKRKRLLVSEKVHAGTTSATLYKVRKLIRR